MQKISERAVELLLLLVVFIWGANFIVIKSVLREISPLAFNAVRMTIAALVLGTIWLLREKELKMPAHDWLKFLGVGVLGNAVYQILFIIGLDLTTSGVSSLLIGTIPVWAALLAMMLRWEKITGQTWVGILIAFAGVTLVTLGSPSSDLSDGPQAKNSFLGNGLTLLAAACWAGYTVLSKKLLERYSALRVSAAGLLLGVLGLWPFALLDVLTHDWRTVSSVVWGSIVYASCISIALAYLIWSYGIQKIGAARTSVFNNLVPVVTFALAFMVLHEPITWLQALGGTIVLAGVWQTTRKT